MVRGGMQLSDISTIGLIVVLAVVIGYAVTGDRSFITEQNPTAGTEKVMAEMLRPLPNFGKGGRLQGISDWINTEPLETSDLRGKVVLVDFWTYSCINCIRTFPYVQGWHEKYKDDGFILLGVHSPEFEFEKELANVQAAAEKHGLTYPIAIDNDHRTWNSFKNRFWPAHYLMDVDGNIRYVHFGEGKYAETDAAIHNLLVEAGLRTPEGESIAVPDENEDGTIREPRTAETYLGYLRINNLGNGADDILADQPYSFSVPDELEDDRFYLGGEWSIHPEFARPVTDAGGTLTYRYRAKEVNIVADTEGSPEKIEVLLNGAALPAALAGADIERSDGKTFVTLDESRLYNIISAESNETHEVEFILPSSTVRIFTFTFG